MTTRLIKALSYKQISFAFDLFLVFQLDKQYLTGAPRQAPAPAAGVVGTRVFILFFYLLVFDRASSLNCIIILPTNNQII